MSLRILIQTPDLSEGDGIANVIMGQYDKLIENGCVVDFAEKEHNLSSYTQKIENNNGKFLLLKSLKDIKTIKSALKLGAYDIVHINHGNLFAYILIHYARKYHVKKIIWHSHNTKITIHIKSRIKHLLNYFFGVSRSNCFLACTEKAGKDIFGNKKFYILNNAIDVSKFKFDFQVRKKIREQFNIDDDCFVVGTVCRYSIQKNPFFMLDIIKEIKKSRKVKFLWVGSSSEFRDEIYSYIAKENLSNDVIMVGMVSNPWSYYNAMDAFIMPSFWEGLGITYIEAQANGLPTYASDVVPKEAAISSLFNSLPINQGIRIWVEALLRDKIRSNKTNLDIEEVISSKGYDLKTYSGELFKIYKLILENKGE